MTIFVVLVWFRYEPGDILGVRSTREGAEDLARGSQTYGDEVRVYEAPVDGPFPEKPVSIYR